jgi:phosphatidate cytidylyltransferase
LLIRPALGLSAPAPDTWRWIVYGVVIAIAGMFGDLAESLLKREAGVKNSSTWMPGLGGVLDVLDSILFAAPIAYACWAFGLLS